LFFYSYGALQIDQIACVHNFLLEFTMDAFYAKCKCDVEWGARFMRPAPKIGICYSENKSTWSPRAYKVYTILRSPKRKKKKCRFIVDHECISHFFHDAFSHLRWVGTSLPDPANEEKGILPIWGKILELWEPERTKSQYLQIMGLLSLGLRTATQTKLSDASKPDNPTCGGMEIFEIGRVR
jgi:hypothetical protein